MPQITLGRSDILKLRTFCIAHKTGWFMAKDEGAYVGASIDAMNRCLWYFKGCDPTTKFDDWHHNADEMFGHDDFGEMLPMDWLHHVARDPSIVKVTVYVDATRVKAAFFR